MKKKVLFITAMMACAGLSAQLDSKVQQSFSERKFNSVESVSGFQKQSLKSNVAVKDIKQTGIINTSVNSSNLPISSFKNVKTRAGSPEALYLRPNGYFYWGVSEDFSYFSQTDVTFLLGPAYEEATWYNLSSEDSEVFTWEFTDPTFASSEPVTSNAVNPSIKYPYAEFQTPVLTASAGGASSTYQLGGEEYGFVRTGGQPIYNFDQGDLLFGAGNYLPSLGYVYYGYGNGAIFGANHGDFWGEKTLTGLAEYFDKPLHKYMLTKLWLFCVETAASSDAKLTVIVHRINDQNQLADTIATSTCYMSDLVDLGDGFYSAPFIFTEIDPETGREQESYLEIEDAILVEITGYNDGSFRAFNPLCQRANHPTEESTAFVALEENGEIEFWNVAQAVQTDAGRVYTSFLMGMEVAYTFLLADDYTYNAPDNGGTKTFDITSYWTADSWWLTQDVPGWITLGNIGQSNNGYQLPVTVAPLVGIGRGADIKIASYGCDITLRVNQGDITGIDGTTVEAIKVIRNGNAYQLEYPSSLKSVSVVSISGQVVGEYALSGDGQMELSLEGLSQGVYVLKFDGDKTHTVKILK